MATALVVASPPLLAAAFFDFHPSALAVPWIATAVLGAVRGDRRLTAVAAVATILCRADLGVVLLGVAVVSRPRARRALVLIGGLGAAVAVLLPDQLGNPGSWDAYYADLGDGPLDAVLHPWRLVGAAGDRAGIVLVLGWLLAVGMLPLFRPRWLVAVLVAAAPVLLNGFPGPTLPWFHHGASFVPLLVGGTLTVLARPPSLADRVRPSLRPVLVAAPVALAVALVSPLSPSAPGSTQVWRALEARPDAERALALVRTDDVVSASPRLVPRLAHRRRIHQYPLPFSAPRTVFPPGLAPGATPEDVAAVDVILVEGEGSGEDVVVSGFRVVAHHDGVAVLRRVGLADG